MVNVSSILNRCRSWQPPQDQETSGFFYTGGGFQEPPRPPLDSEFLDMQQRSRSKEQVTWVTHALNPPSGVNSSDSLDKIGHYIPIVI